MDQQASASGDSGIPAMDWYICVPSKPHKWPRIIPLFCLLSADSTGQVGGYVTHFEKQFTYTTVRGAGHMVCIYGLHTYTCMHTYHMHVQIYAHMHILYYMYMHSSYTVTYIP